MNDKLLKEFRAKELQIVELCRQIGILLKSASQEAGRDTGDYFMAVSDQLESLNDIEEKRDIVSVLQSSFHKDGIFDCPPDGIDVDAFNKNAKALNDLLWIYQESRFVPLWKK